MVKIKTISKENFKKIYDKVKDWSGALKAHLLALINKLDGSTHRALVAVEGKTVMGFILYSVYDRRGNKTVTIDLTAVNPEHRQQGIATSLKLYVANKHKAATIQAEVDPKNVASANLNKSLGATTIGKTMTMEPRVMLEKAQEKQAAMIRPVTKKASKALLNIQKERAIQEHGCPPGKKKVRSYTTKKGTHVAAYCRKSK